MQTTTDSYHNQYQDIRDAVRALCADFPDEYHRKVDAARAYLKRLWTRSPKSTGWPC
jgi:acyl-CoA dehydrogenase